MRKPALITVALTGLLLTACGGASEDAASTSSGSTSSSSEQTVTIYSGRNEQLVGPLLQQITAATGTAVEVRYGDSSALAAQIMEEGDKSPADLFFSQDAGALGALAKADRLAPLDDAVTGAVLDGYADDKGAWVATSARARVIAYDPRQAPEAARMTSIDQILDPKYKGKVGFAPTNASFHSFVTALRLDRGEAGAEQWLTRFKANQPKAYEKNGAVLNAVDAGEVSLGLINHYYWHELVAEKGAAKVNAKIHFLNSDDPGALINVAGVGVLASSDAREGANEVAAFLVSKQAQQYFVDETSEYPVIAGVTATKTRLTPLDTLTASSVDLGSLDSLPASLALLDQVGLT